MQLSGKVYTYLKWATLILIPACTTAYVGLSAIWGWPYATEVAKTSAVCCTLLGSLLGISTAQYYQNGEDEDPDAKYWDDDEDGEPKK